MTFPSNNLSKVSTYTCANFWAVRREVDKGLSKIAYMSLSWQSAVFLARNTVPLYLTFNQIREPLSITYSYLRELQETWEARHSKREKKKKVLYYYTFQLILWM